MKYEEMLTETIIPVVEMVPDNNLKVMLTESLTESRESLKKIENCFSTLPKRRWSQDFLARFFQSWKASHLKMLAIYGLSCRLQRLAVSAEGPKREQLFISSARNAETSHEDLGLDFNGGTHAELYDNFAAAFLNDSTWQSEAYCLPEGKEFKRWVYHNMVVDDITKGLLTNLFSEIYNHAEYTLALRAFSDFIDTHYDFSPEERQRALHYINAHVDNSTEVDHFLVVVEALSQYHDAVGLSLDYGEAKELFKEYTGRLGSLMENLTQMMTREQGDERDQ